ncbi:hypothetical protein HELRODRAFT_116302 [Helobdella robusta]|uniref:VPS10 domain-containing protein n=1 Tax=Helobdella robusta TaxID=6412 RepID=T1EGE1_HELRO|nr:hypothetical protein HELRODRAFT_116302 [Helobdella robusta]ESN91848.1 hypothetical protein HELRODRAFT_116302 [Helobdella robusta]
MDLKSFILIHFCVLIIYFSRPKTCQQLFGINGHNQLCTLTTGKFASFLNSSGADVSNIFGQEYHINSSKSSVLEIAWTGENYDQVVLLTASDRESGLYIWDTKDDFKNKRNITDLIHANMSNSEARLHLHKHPLDPKMIYVTILKYNGNLDTDLHISNDSGQTFHAVSTLNFTVTQSTDLIFHPTKVDLILFLDSYDSLHLSRNRGYTWVNIANDTRSAKWGQSSTCQDCIFINHNSQSTVSNLLLFSIKQYSPFMNTLMRSLDYGSSWTALKEHIYSFGLEDNFTYVSVYTDWMRMSERKLQVSLNDGEHWSNVRLPGIDNDQFFSILDSRDGQMFIHIDDPGDTGRGTLYVSDTTGLVFSAVLRQHLFPNFEDVTDFYRVLSMKGVYITNQIMRDDSVRTVISYNRGVEWVDVPRPQGAPCVNEDQPCFLQIHNRYSKSRGLRTAPPLSVPNAIGIIMVHGRLTDSLQTDDPDVFISNDGGYSWYLGLEGPHHYEIADNGGLLVAVPANTNQPKVIKFSTDVGRCWSTYKFTDEDITFTGLLTTPTNKGSTVAIWGFSERKALWHTFVFNFSKVVKDKCKESDHETWVPTSHLKGGCLLGSKDTFLRHKSGAWSVI